MKKHAATVRSDWLAKIMHALKPRLDMDIVLRKISFSAWTSRDFLNIDICRVSLANNISWAPQLGFSS